MYGGGGGGGDDDDDDEDGEHYRLNDIGGRWDNIG